MSKSDHWNGKAFYNPWGRSDKSFKDFLKIAREIQNSPWPSRQEIGPIDPVIDRIEDSSLHATLINHSTVLLQFDGINVLTDPVFSERVSPISFAGPKRIHPPAIPFKQLPKIDLVLLSHNHYDHLDLEYLKKLSQKDEPTIVTGLGVGDFLLKRGCRHVAELDWWDSLKFKDHEVTFTPAQHFSSRGIHDRNRTLWGGLTVNSSRGLIYFAGDTGYAPFFKDIKERLGAPILSLLPIGAYEPRWFMEAMHMNPEDAVKAHLDLESQNSFGIHFGCFKLTAEGVDQPLKDLEAACLQHRAKGFLGPKVGKRYIF